MHGTPRPEDIAELKSLQASLDSSSSDGSFAPSETGRRLAYCTRAARRLEKARAAEAVVRLEAELQEGLQAGRTQGGRSFNKSSTSGSRADHVRRPAEEVNLSRTAVMEFTRERDSLRSRVPPTVVVDDSSPVVPTQPGGSSGIMDTLIDGGTTVQI